MKIIFPYFMLLLLGLACNEVNAQVGIGTTNPKQDALLDIVSNDKGILIPRVNLTSFSVFAPVVVSSGNGTESLLVYNTNPTLGKGFYYWNGIDRWVPIGSEVQKGMQFYSYNFVPNPPTPPDFNLLLNGTVAARSGSYTGSLNITSADFVNTGLIPTNNTNQDGFAVKLVGFYSVKTTGNFTINSTSDDGVRIYIDDSLVLIDWEDSGNNEATGTIKLAKGKHKFEFWFFENAGSQKFNFRWGANPDGLPEGSMHATQFSTQ